MRIAIIGCGAICRGILDAVKKGYLTNVEIVALLDRDVEKCRRIAQELGMESVSICSNIEDLLRRDPEIVVEVASPAAVRQYAIPILERGKILIVLSSGALLDEDLRKRIIETCERTGARVMVPSGAIGGIDILKALAVAGIERIVMRTRKPVRALPVEEKIEKPKTLYKGPASEAVKKFPLNVNIVATVTLVSKIEPEIEVIADPEITENIHEIEIESKISKVKIVLRNIPTPWNPRTSYIAVYSTISLLKELCEKQHIIMGT
ncbi:MAG: aspartate dehydrogenase [Crenarchaeota archaeon]|nr:aspartate dehydrogenase [Thermoproteota archaeon]